MRDSTGARIIFPTEKDEDREVITIIGREEAVKKAKAELEVLIKELVGPSLNSTRSLSVSHPSPESTPRQMYVKDIA